MNASQKATHALLDAYCDQWDHEIESVDDDADGEVFLICEYDTDTEVKLVIDDTGDLDTLEAEHLLSRKAREFADELIEGVYDLRGSGDPDELNFDDDLTVTVSY